MKKYFTLLALALFAIISCEKNSDSETGIYDPATKVLTPDEQKQRIKDVAEAALDEVDKDAINAEIKKAFDLYDEALALDEEGVVVQKIENVVKSLTTTGNIQQTVYDLYPFRGHYSVINKQQSFTPAENIEANYNNKWFAKVDFSTNRQKILVSTYSYAQQQNKEYVELPETTSILVQRDGQTILNAKVEISTNITDLTSGFDSSKNWSVGGSLECLGYVISITKISYANKAAASKTSISHNRKELLSEDISVSGIEFTDNRPTGAGKASFDAKFMNSIQIKANTSNVTAYVNNYNTMYSYYNSEKDFKSYLEKLNTLVESGVYFSSDIKQCHFEFYPFQDTNSGYWSAEPVFVLEDGTKYSFSKEYFDSVIKKYEELISSLNVKYSE